MRGLSLVAASGGHSSSRCAGLSLSRPLLLRSTGSRRPGSVVVAHGPSCSAACGILPDQGSNLCALHWQADSQPLRHQGSPLIISYSDQSTCLPDSNPVPSNPIATLAPIFLNCNSHHNTSSHLPHCPSGTQEPKDKGPNSVAGQAGRFVTRPTQLH